MAKKEKLPPNYSRLDKALRSIGYSFEAAVADIIDNSIDAQAKNILVRFILRKNKPLDLVIWDDGEGMNDKRLKEAMRFGADIDNHMDRLGKFGLGLKLASLSQAQELHVISSHSSQVSGRAWLEDGISSGFLSTVFEPKDCAKSIKAVVPDKSWKKSGTVVWWSNLYRVGQNFSDPDGNAQKLLRRLKDYLSLSFHRFLQGEVKDRKISIDIDIFDGDESLEGLPLSLQYLDPFGYTKTGHDDYPAKLVPSARFAKKLKITGHIWPPNSSSPQYTLPGGANSRQGFYFYRNNRLIQGGGWNGMLEPEPHRSLARLEIDMDPHFDLDLSLDVKKVEIQLNPPLVKAIREAQTKSGVGFKKYLAIADETYRTKPLTQKELPIIPNSGLPVQLRKFLLNELSIKGIDRFRKLDFKWTKLGKNQFFLLDHDTDTLHLNEANRNTLLNGRKGSSADVPIVKCLLFLALKDILNFERTSPKTRKYIDLVNETLTLAAKFEKNGK